MSDNEGRTTDGRFDRAIDGAVREMLDVQPPAGLRGRVLDRIERRSASGFRRPASSWRFVVLAAAAVLVAIVLTRHAAPVTPVTSTVATAPERTSPPQTARPGGQQPIVVAQHEAPAVPAARAKRVREMRMAVAAIAGAEDGDFATVEPLAGPHAIDVARLPGPAATAMAAIEPAPIGIAPLEVTALSETPRERREE